MRSMTTIGATSLSLLAVSFSALPAAVAHPGAGIVVDGDGQVYFGHTGFGIWKIDTQGQLVRHAGPGWHFLVLDPKGDFADQRWPRFREQMRPGVIRYGDSEIHAVGRSPTLVCASSFPIARGTDGALYYPEPGTEELLHIKRLEPGGRPTDFATLPLAMEIAPNNKPWKALWLHGLAAGPDGTLYYSEKEAVRRVDAKGNVSLVVENIKVPGCVHGKGHRGGPILRELDVAADGTIYAAAMACQAVIRIMPAGEIDVVLKSEDSWTPTGIAVHGDDLYVLEFWFAEPEKGPDAWHPRVRKLAGDGTVTVLATVTEADKKPGS